MGRTKKYKGLVERLFWLINLRWVAIAGVSLTICFVNLVIRIQLPLFRLYIFTALLAVYNTIIYIVVSRQIKKKHEDYIPIAKKIANIQISFDLLCLAALIHFSGGVENPFIFFFIFHVIIASILLSRGEAFLQATLAVFLFCSVVVLEYFGILQHYDLRIFGDHGFYKNIIYISGVSFVFISTIYIAAYMATSISVRLRCREKNLKEANELLTEKDRAKSRYVLHVTHDIKEHLAAIQGCIAPVTAGMMGSVDPKQRALLNRAVGRIDKLLFFVKALLELSRIKLNGHEKMQYFSVSETVKNALACVRPRAEQKGIELTGHTHLSIDKIKGVQAYIEETISNLLANSIKYTHENGKVTLDVKDEENTILIQIKDTGIGIPSDDLPMIFDEFYRAANAKEVEKDGSGLGLSIAKEVAERHGGRIWAESEEGKGSSFYIRLPK